MIRLGILFPDHLNLNGDSGNVEVISKQLQWRGIASEIVRLDSLEQLEAGLDFVLVGHGSSAAWAAIEEKFASFVPALRVLKNAGTTLLSVSTGYEQLVTFGLFSNLQLKRAQLRTSKFVVHGDDGREVLGYLNSDAELPAVHREQNWVGTLLHGPVLAKNPELLDEVLAAVTKRAGYELRDFQENEKAGQLADLVSEVWKLERELASE